MALLLSCTKEKDRLVEEMARFNRPRKVVVDNGARPYEELAEGDGDVPLSIRVGLIAAIITLIVVLSAGTYLVYKGVRKQPDSRPITTSSM